jgi:phosphoserine aminotransferase
MNKLIDELLKKHTSYQGIADACKMKNVHNMRLWRWHTNDNAKIKELIDFMLWSKKDLRIGAKEFLELLK